MTETVEARPTAGAIGFLMLADELRVIKASPAWTEVRRAIAELRDASDARKTDQALEEDASHVRTFAAILHSEAALIASAIRCGRALGAVRESGTPAERTLHALRTVSRAYRFEALDDDGVEAKLREVRVKLAERFPILASWAISPDPEIVNDDIDAWRGALSQLLARLTAVMETISFDRAAYRAAAWRAWLERVKTATDTVKVQEPTIDELLCGAAGMLPTEILRFDLARVSLPEWSRVLTGATGDIKESEASYCPPWMLLVALHVLGFRFSSEDLARWVRAIPSLTSSIHQDTSMWRLFGTPGAPSRTLFFIPDTGSMAAEWVATPQMAILPVTTTLYERLNTMLSPVGGLVRTLGISQVVAEISGPTPSTAPLSAVIKQLLDGTFMTGQLAARPVFLFASPPITPPPGPCVIAPKRIEDVLTVLHQTSVEP